MVSKNSVRKRCNLSSVPPGGAALSSSTDLDRQFDLRKIHPCIGSAECAAARINDLNNLLKVKQWVNNG